MRRSRRKTWPHVKYYGYGMVNPCPWNLPEQTVPSKAHYELWKKSKGNRKQYIKLKEKYECLIKK